MTEADRQNLQQMLESGNLQVRTEQAIELAEAYKRAGLGSTHIDEFIKHLKRGQEVLEDFRKMLRMARRPQPHPEFQLEGGE